MDTIVKSDGFTVAGIALRTNNAAALRTIPPLWERFWSEHVLSSIPDRANDDVFVVYTNFSNEGVDTSGDYTMVIGARVTSTDSLPDGLIAVVVPASDRVRFPVPDNDPALILEAWKGIWSRADLNQNYLADYEHYPAQCDISIMIGVHPA